MISVQIHPSPRYVTARSCIKLIIRHTDYVYKTNDHILVETRIFAIVESLLQKYKHKLSVAY